MVRDSIYNIERNTADIAQSAATAAQHGATTARAAQSAAAGAWVGAGVQAVTALQSARAARAAEEQLAVQRAMAEQAQMHAFAMWSQTPDGAAFTSWRDQAIHLAQFIRGRRSEWQQTWAQVISRFQGEIPEDEKHRFATHGARLQQSSLLVTGIISLILAPLAFISALQIGRQYLPPFPPDIILFTSPLFLAAGITLLVIRARRVRAARTDTRVGEEAAARVSRYGFDPLTVAPGWEPFSWNATGSADADSYSDAIMHLALTGHRTFPARHQLIPLHVPAASTIQPYYPDEVRAALARFSG